MKIIDCFVFYNELDMLNLRLHELNEHVDYFILVEANKTYSNNPKNFIFEQNKFKYQKFLHKIIHIKVNDMPNGTNNWEREFHQRNCIGRGVELVTNLDDEDIILLSDVDEIIKHETIMKLKKMILSIV